MTSISISQKKQIQNRGKMKKDEDDLEKVGQSVVNQCNEDFVCVLKNAVS